jgi:hypothetical protein
VAPFVPRLPKVHSLTRELRSKVANTLTARAFEKVAGRNGPVPDDGIAVFFGAGPENGYQLDQWRRPLESLARRRGVFLIADRADTGRYLLENFDLPIAFARGSGALEVLVDRHRVRAVLYVNQVEPNFRMMRFAEPLHIQLGHGESDKGGSVSNQHKAYDLTFVGGEAGLVRLADALYDFDADQRIRLVGRPQLDYDYPGAPDWPDDGSIRVLYAPTWEGDRPSIRYSSVLTHGHAIIEALRADPRIRIIYRPHPRTGWVSAEHGAADLALRALLEADGDRHLIDVGPYGWQWGFADACVTDVSAVAYDWLATRKPMVITRPAEEVYLPSSRLLDALPLLPVEQANDVTRRLLDGDSPALLDTLAEHYFGDTSPGASTRRFEDVLEEAITQRAAEIVARASRG